MKIINLFRPETTGKAIIFSMTLSLVAKLFTFAQTRIAGQAFGLVESTDILFYALSTIILITSFVSSVNQSVLVPTAIDIRNNESEEQSKRFISFNYTIYLTIGILVTIVLYLLPLKTFGFFSKFSIEAIQNNILIIKFIIPVFFLIIANTYILDIFTSYRYFTMPMFLDMLKNIAIILFIMIFKRKLSVLSLAIGVLAGNAAQFILLNFLLFKKMGFKLSFEKYQLSSKSKKNIMYVLLGQIAWFINSFAIMYLLTGYQAGVYSAIDTSQKIFTMVSMIIIGQISTVIGMNIIESYTKGRFAALNIEFMKYFKLSMFVVTSLCFIMAICSKEIITLLFQGGKFDSNAVLITSNIFKYFILGVPFLLMDAFIVRLINAKQLQRVSFMWQIFSNAMTLGIVWLLISRIGYMGYPIGLLISNMIYVVLLATRLVKKHFEFIPYKQLLWHLIINFLINTGIFVLIEMAKTVVPKAQNNFANFVSAVLITIIYVTIILTISYITKFGMDSIDIIRVKICKILKLKAWKEA